MGKKVIGIHAGFLFYPIEYMHQWDETNLEKGGIGGSEVWAVEIGKRFQQLGYQVVMFGDCKTVHFTEDGMLFVPCDELQKSFRDFHFDYFIASRDVYILGQDINADHIFLMFHDTMVPVRLYFYEDDYLSYDEKYRELVMNKVEKVFYQSEYQKWWLKYRYQIPEEKFVLTCQAIDFDLYKDVDFSKKKNKMVWSTHKDRGAKMLIEKIFPLIKAEVPDFEIDVCGYVNDMVDPYFKVDGINVLGNVPKEELIRKQMEAKIWIYPNTGKLVNGDMNDETFCITAIENAAAKNALILANRTCFCTTLGDYTHFVGTHLFGDNFILDDEYVDEFCHLLAQQAIDILKTDKNEEIGNEAYKICKRYNWMNAALSFINEF